MKSSYVSSLAHTILECEYYIVFAQKFRVQEIYGKIKQDIGIILRKRVQKRGAVVEAC